MSLIYLAGWSTDGSNQKMTMTIDGNVATLDSATWSHHSFEDVLGSGNYSDFATGVKAAADAAGGGAWTVARVADVYTISRATNFTLNFDFTNAANARLARALGFSNIGLRSGQNTYSSDVRPYFYIVAEMPGRSAALPLIYEPDGIVMEAVSDGGTSYAVSKNTTEKWSDWTQTMEPEAAVFDRSATAAVPYTWQMFWIHVRGQYPFAFYETDVWDALFKMRASAGSWKAIPVTADWIELYNLKFQARYLGDLKP